MQAQRRAVIDVGTNSVKLLLAEVSSQDVRPLREESIQTRLGRGLYHGQRLQAEAIQATGEAVATLAATAQSHGAERVRVFATSAAREASNSEELLDAIQRRSKLTVRVLSGEEEADWTFRGMTSDPRFSTVPVLLMDSGGGSTEFILGQGKNKCFARSYPLGTVRTLEMLPHSEPPLAQELARCRDWVIDFLEKNVKRELRLAMESFPNVPGGFGIGQKFQLVATGGTATIMARIESHLDSYDRERIEATQLTSAAVRARVEALWSVPLEERRRVVGLPPNRADVILAGSVIFEGIMQTFGFTEMRISTRGLRFAALLAD